MRFIIRLVVASLGMAPVGSAFASDMYDVWPSRAPNESSDSRGQELPPRAADPSITRIVNVRRPSFAAFRPDQPNGTAVVILPGGGFGRVVPDLEGSEAADWLAKRGVTSFVLRYRTSEAKSNDEPIWKRPLEDAQRTIRVVRAMASEFEIDPDRVGLLAFSAGGQVGAIAMSRGDEAVYQSIDEVDERSCRPSFGMLVYPWRIHDTATAKLIDPIAITKGVGPMFIVHTHDDASTAVGAAQLYIACKLANVPAELHIFETGGHGYGTRSRPNSVIGTWPRRADDWLALHGLIATSSAE